MQQQYFINMVFIGLSKYGARAPYVRVSLVRCLFYFFGSPASISYAVVGFSSATLMV